MKQDEKELLIRIDERLAAHEEAVSTAHSAFKITLNEVLLETKKTNGRLKELENWRSKVKGAWGATLVIGTILGMVIGWLVGS